MSVAIDVKILNLDKIRRAFKKSPEITAKHMKLAIRNCLQEIQRQTIPLTPHKYGELEQSLLRGIEVRPLGGRIFSDKVYALAQHEHTEWKHPIKGQAKYLEAGVSAAKAQISNYLKEGLQNALKEIEQQAQ